MASKTQLLLCLLVAFFFFFFFFLVASEVDAARKLDAPSGKTEHPQIADPQVPSLRFASPKLVCLHVAPALLRLAPLALLSRLARHPRHRCGDAAVPTHGHGVCGGDAGRLLVPMAVSLPHQPDAQLPLPRNEMMRWVSSRLDADTQRRGRGCTWSRFVREITRIGDAPHLLNQFLEDRIFLHLLDNFAL